MADQNHSEGNTQSCDSNSSPTHGHTRAQTHRPARARRPRSRLGAWSWGSRGAGSPARGEPARAGEKAGLRPGSAGPGGGGWLGGRPERGLSPASETPGFPRLEATLLISPELWLITQSCRILNLYLMPVPLCNFFSLIQRWKNK